MELRHEADLAWARGWGEYKEMSTVGKTEKMPRRPWQGYPSSPRQRLKGTTSLGMMQVVGTDASVSLISGPGRSHDGKVYRLEKHGHSQRAPEMLHPGLKPTRRDRKERGCLGRGSYGWQWVDKDEEY